MPKMLHVIYYLFTEFVIWLNSYPNKVLHFNFISVVSSSKYFDRPVVYDMVRFNPGYREGIFVH